MRIQKFLNKRIGEKKQAKEKQEKDKTRASLKIKIHIVTKVRHIFGSNYHFM